MRVSLLAVGSRGDVQPLVALGAELRKRGHPVRLATHREFQPLVDEAGLDYSFLPGGPSAIPAKANSPLKLFRALVRYLNQIAPELATQTRIACQDADLVVDNALSHTSAVESLSAPWCMVLYQPLMPTSAFPAPGQPTLPLGPAYNRLTHLAAYSLQQQPLNRLLGLAPKQIRFPWRTVGLNRPALFAFSPTVIAPPADWPPSCHVTGYWFWNRSCEPPSQVLNLLQKGTPPIALTFGSMWPFAPVKATELAAQGASRPSWLDSAGGERRRAGMQSTGAVARRCVTQLATLTTPLIQRVPRDGSSRLAMAIGIGDPRKPKPLRLSGAGPCEHAPWPVQEVGGQGRSVRRW